MHRHGKYISLFLALSISLGGSYCALCTCSIGTDWKWWHFFVMFTEWEQPNCQNLSGVPSCFRVTDQLCVEFVWKWAEFHALHRGCRSQGVHLLPNPTSTCELAVMSSGMLSENRWESWKHEGNQVLTKGRHMYLLHTRNTHSFYFSNLPTDLRLSSTTL